MNRIDWERQSWKISKPVNYASHKVLVLACFLRRNIKCREISRENTTTMPSLIQATILYQLDCFAPIFQGAYYVWKTLKSCNDEINSLVDSRLKHPLATNKRRSRGNYFGHCTVDFSLYSFPTSKMQSSYQGGTSKRWQSIGSIAIFILP
jgi:hypothetical protein